MPFGAGFDGRFNGSHQRIIQFDMRLKVDGLHLEDAVFTIRLRIEPPDKLVVIGDRQREIAIFALGCGHITLTPLIVG